MVEFLSMPKKKKAEKKTYTLHLNLTHEEFDTLTTMMGIATGAAFRDGMRKLAWAFMRLANLVHKDNKKWKPYPVPEDDEDGSDHQNGAHA